MSDETPRLEYGFEVRVDIGPGEHIGNGAGDVLTSRPSPAGR
jgi:hypothetical protein